MDGDLHTLQETKFANEADPPAVPPIGHVDNGAVAAAPPIGTATTMQAPSNPAIVPNTQTNGNGSMMAAPAAAPASSGMSTQAVGGVPPKPEEGCKLFVGGVSWDTTEDSMRHYFEQFGHLSDCVLMKDRYTGQPRGFGFVTFLKRQSVDSVLQSSQHSLDGKTVEVKQAVPRNDSAGPRGGGGGGGGARGGGGPQTTKVFVGGLASTVTEPTFRQYFEKFGAVDDAVVMYDRDTNRSRGFGFITFRDAQAMERCLQTQHQIDGKYVEVKKAQPRGAMGARSRGGPRGGGHGGGGGYGNGGQQGGYGGQQAGYGGGGYGYGGGHGGYGQQGGYQQPGYGGGGYGAGGQQAGYGGGGYGYGGGHGGYGQQQGGRYQGNQGAYGGGNAGGGYWGGQGQHAPAPGAPTSAPATNGTPGTGGRNAPAGGTAGGYGGGGYQPAPQSYGQHYNQAAPSAGNAPAAGGYAGAPTPYGGNGGYGNQGGYAPTAAAGGAPGAGGAARNGYGNNNVGGNRYRPY